MISTSCIVRLASTGPWSNLGSANWWRRCEMAVVRPGSTARRIRSVAWAWRGAAIKLAAIADKISVKMEIRRDFEKKRNILTVGWAMEFLSAYTGVRGAVKAWSSA